MSWRLAVVGAIFCFASAIITIPTVASTPESSKCNGSDLASSQVLETSFPYYFPIQGNRTDLFPMPPCNGLTLEETTIDQLQDAMNHGKLTSSQLVTCYLQRIYQTNNYIKYVFSSGLHSLLHL